MKFERQKELKLMEEMYQSRSFEMLAVYSRRRQGKTSLLSDFAKERRVLYFEARQVTEAKQLNDFFAAVTEYFGDKNYTKKFRDWEEAFDYISARLTGQRLALIIDEYPTAVSSHKSVKSALQHAISHNFVKENVFLIVSGSDVAFMKEEFVHNKREYYDNLIALNLAQPDYAEAAKFVEGYSNYDKLLAYAVFGGTPAYLAALDGTATLFENIRAAASGFSFLKEEPQNLLAAELREPAVYNAIFEALANGAKKMSEIADFVGEEANKCSKYLDTLRAKELVEKNLPIDESGNSKRGTYRITDNYFSFWFRFVSGRKALGAGETAVDAEELQNYFDGIFPSVCRQYLNRKNNALELPFHFTEEGFVRDDDTGTDFITCLCDGKAVIASCLTHGVADGKTLETMERLRAGKQLFSQRETTFAIFALDGFEKALSEAAVERNDMVLVDAEAMFVFEA